MLLKCIITTNYLHTNTKLHRPFQIPKTKLCRSNDKPHKTVSIISASAQLYSSLSRFVPSPLEHPRTRVPVARSRGTASRATTDKKPRRKQRVCDKNGREREMHRDMPGESPANKDMREKSGRVDSPTG